jgi:dihydrofolate reductase
MIKAIVCCDKNWAIGKNNDLLFHLPTDMKQFKIETSESVVVCGYNTLLSFPGSKPLKGRSTICLCPPEIERDDCFCVHSFEKLVRLVKELAKTQDVWVIGGAMMYKSLLSYYDLVLVTKVDADGEGTVFFPNLDENPDFELTWTSDSWQDGEYTLTFNTYEKINRD